MSRIRRIGTAARLYAAVVALTLGGAVAAVAAPIPFQNGTATCSQTDGSGTFLVDYAINGVVSNTDGWAIFCGGFPVAQTAVFETTGDVLSAAVLRFVLIHNYVGGAHTTGRFRLSATQAPRDDFADGLNDGGNLGLPEIWTVLDPAFASSTASVVLTEQGDHSILASGPSPNSATYTVLVANSPPGMTGIRLELLEDASLPFSGPGREATNGNLVLTEMTLETCPDVLLDLDDDLLVQPLTDGLLLLRYLFGFRGPTLIAGATGGLCERCLAPDIEAYIASILGVVDIDGDGTPKALTDGLLFLRYAFGFSGTTLTNGATALECTRCDAAAIEPVIGCLSH